MFLWAAHKAGRISVQSEMQHHHVFTRELHRRLLLQSCHQHPSAFPISALGVPRHMRSLLVGRTYRHKRQCQPNSSEHRGGDGALLVGVAQAGVATVETPLVRTDRGLLQNQAGQHSYTHKYGGTYEPTPALAADPHPKCRQPHVSTMLHTCNLRKKIIASKGLFTQQTFSCCFC